MQSKHLWYTIDISWQELDKKLQALAPIGLTGEQLWQHLFLTKHRQNPFVEGRYEWIAKKWRKNGRQLRGTFRTIRDSLPFSVNLGTAIRGFDIDNIAAQQVVENT